MYAELSCSLVFQQIRHGCSHSNNWPARREFLDGFQFAFLPSRFYSRGRPGASQFLRSIHVPWEISFVKQVQKKKKINKRKKLKASWTDARNMGSEDVKTNKRASERLPSRTDRENQYSRTEPGSKREVSRPNYLPRESPDILENSDRKAVLVP